MAGPSQGGNGLLKRSASARAGHRDLTQDRKLLHQGSAKTPYYTEFIRFFGERLLVHVQLPIELDLNRVDSGGGAAIANGRVPAPVRLVVGQPEVEAGRDPLVLLR